MSVCRTANNSNNVCSWNYESTNEPRVWKTTERVAKLKAVRVEKYWVSDWERERKK